MTVDAFCAFMMLSAFVAFFYGPWQSICVDIARQLLFEQRDRLFDLAAAGRMDFQSHQYRSLRASLERSIRFAHELTLPKLIYTAQILEINDDTPSELTLVLLQIHDLKIRDQVSKIMNKSSKIVLSAILVRSSVLIIFLPFIFLLMFDAFVLSKAGHMLRMSIKRVGEVAQKEADIYA